MAKLDCIFHYFERIGTDSKRGALFCGCLLRMISISRQLTPFLLLFSFLTGQCPEDYSLFSAKASNHPYLGKSRFAQPNVLCCVALRPSIEPALASS